MKFSVLSQNGTHNLGSDFIQYLHPSDAMYNYCMQIETAQMPSEYFQGHKETKFAISQLPNNNTGEKQKQNILESINRSFSYPGNSPSKSQPRLPPAPMRVGTSVTPRANAVGGKAMAVGIMLQKARTSLLYKDIHRTLKTFIKSIVKKQPHSHGVVVAVNIIYLRVRRDYGRAPMLGGVTLLNNIDESYNRYSFVTESIERICKPTLKPAAKSSNELIIRSVSDFDNPKLYSNATLFVECKW